MNGKLAILIVVEEASMGNIAEIKISMTCSDVKPERDRQKNDQLDTIVTEWQQKKNAWK